MACKRSSVRFRLAPPNSPHPAIPGNLANSGPAFIEPPSLPSFMVRRRRIGASQARLMRLGSAHAEQAQDAFANLPRQKRVGTSGQLRFDGDGDERADLVEKKSRYLDDKFPLRHAAFQIVA